LEGIAMLRRVGISILLAMAWLGPAAADYLGGVRAWGRGDFAAAAREFAPAAQAGDAESQYMMGRLYSLGDGVPQDFVQAWAWFDRAARQGHAMAAQSRAGMGDILTPQQMAQAQGAARPVVAQAPAAQPAQAAQPIQGRQVVLVPRQGVVAAVPAPRAPSANPARMSAPAATAEGHMMASGRLREQVTDVQRELMAAGYYDGPADGDLGAGTRQAIRAYQRNNGLPQTGLLSHRMMEQLAMSPKGQADQQQAAR
jgi:localization factor PodJL